MMPEKKTKALATFTLILALFSLSVYFSMFFFMKNRISETMQKQNEIKTAIEKKESLSLTQKSIEDNQVNEDKISGYIVKSNSVADFIKIMESIVASSGLKSQVGSISYESSNNLSAFNAELLDVKITALGPWSNIHFFLQLLENYPLKIDIRSVSLKKFTDYVVKGKDVPQWSADIDFTVVKFKDI